MTFPYAMRLLCLCLELLFLVNLAASVLAWALSRSMAHAADKMQPRRAAQGFLGLRLLPFALALAVVAFLGAPSYLRFEENPSSEPLGLTCLALAALGAALCLSFIYSILRAFIQIRRLDKAIGLTAAQPTSTTTLEMHIAEQDAPNMPLLALVGILRPRLIVSRRLLTALSPDQLQAALSHERAHLLQRDNLKRLLIAVLPGALPFASGFAAIERHWSQHAELAADDTAAQSFTGGSLALAEALLHAARLANGAHAMPLASSLSDSATDLTRRVNRLLRADTATPPQSDSAVPLRQRLLAPAALLLALLTLLPQISKAIYPMLETLLH